MGTFASIFVKEDRGIYEDKINEFAERVEKVFQCGGMMDVATLELFGKKIVTISKAKMTSQGMQFCYNYFENDSWEHAGFNSKTNNVWSGKIGWSEFNWAVVAAYVLKEQYTDGVAVAMINSDPVSSWIYVGWLNYLFDEQKHIKNFDTWKLFEAFYYAEDLDYICEKWDNWSGFGTHRYAFISGLEICSVILGVKKALEIFEPLAEEKTERIAFQHSEKLWLQLQLFEQQEDFEEKRCLEILEVIKEYYSNKDRTIAAQLYEGKYKELLLDLQVSDAPAFAVKAISEIFRKDFRELWDVVKDVAERKLTDLYKNDDYYVLPIPTEKFFNQSPDDMIYYWKDDGKLAFSDTLWEWFGTLRQQYDVMMKKKTFIKRSLQHIVDLLTEANDHYHHIFAFTEFFEETMERLSDKRYQVLWRIFEKMVHDIEFLKNYDKFPDKRLEVFEKRRGELRRFLALVANKNLRMKVFGF